MMLTKAFSAVKSKLPRSLPCVDSTPAKGVPASRAVNFATVAEVLIPDGYGLVIISKGGLLPFSNTIQVHVSPKPPGSKSIGAF